MSIKSSSSSPYIPPNVSHHNHRTYNFQKKTGNTSVKRKLHKYRDHFLYHHNVSKYRRRLNWRKKFLHIGNNLKWNIVLFSLSLTLSLYFRMQSFHSPWRRLYTLCVPVVIYLPFSFSSERMKRVKLQTLMGWRVIHNGENLRVIFVFGWYRPYFKIWTVKYALQNSEFDINEKFMKVMQFICLG